MVTLWIAAVGLFAGVMGGLLGVGGGIVIVPLLILLLGFETKLAIGTSLAAIVPTAIMAAWQHDRAHRVDWKVVMMLSSGSILGAYIGSTLVTLVPSDWLRRGFALFLIATAVKMLWK